MGFLLTTRVRTVISAVPTITTIPIIVSAIPIVSATTTIHGTVTEMDYTSGSPQPSVNGTVVDLGDLLKLTAHKADEEDTG